MVVLVTRTAHNHARHVRICIIRTNRLVQRRRLAAATTAAAHHFVMCDVSSWSLLNSQSVLNMERRAQPVRFVRIKKLVEDMNITIEYQERIVEIMKNPEYSDDEKVELVAEVMRESSGRKK